MSALPHRIQIWPSRDLRRAAHAAGCDPDAIAAAVRWKAAAPKPGDDAARWNRAFLEALEAARADRAADDFTSN